MTVIVYYRNGGCERFGDIDRIDANGWSMVILYRKKAIAVQTPYVKLEVV